MFCSNCGKELGAVAHIMNDQLLCEDCYAKLHDTTSVSPQTGDTLVLGAAREEELRSASEAIPKEENVGSNQSDGQSKPRAESTQVQENLVLAKLLVPGESLLWKRSFSKGIINRHLTFTEAVTNLRAICVDDEKMALIRYVPIGRC